MLNHLNLSDYSLSLEKALFLALKSDNRTKDLGGSGTTLTFTKEIINNLKKV